MIHPAAIIHPEAVLGVDCEIGPYCVLGPQVVLGDRCRLHSHVVLDGHTVLGQGNEIYPFSSLGLKTQDLKWKGGVTWTRIGDFNTFRENVTVNSATSDGNATIIGSHNHILNCCHIAHDSVLGDHIIMSGYSGLAGHVIVEDHAILGGYAGVHQFCRIGRLAIIGGASKIGQDVAPYMLVDGNPAQTRAVNKIGLERNGIAPEAQRALRQAHKILFRDGLIVSNALARIEADLPALSEVRHLVEFVRGSERGVVR
ncbi:MAG: acyl-ACP--UDP-N-acetylglucosamine O-acyltransferase [Limisphaerales bacterium]